MTALPRLVFAYEFDERSAYEAEARGYLAHAYVEFPDGSKYPVVFYDPIRLKQDIDTENANGSPFIAEPGMIVVQDVTLANMERTVAKLFQEGFFARLKPSIE